MNIHEELAVIFGKLGMRRIGHEILEELIAGGADHFNFALFFVYGALYCVNRGDCGRSPHVSGAVIIVYHTEIVFCKMIFKQFALREVFVIPAVFVSITVSHHDFRTVNTFPDTDIVGIASVGMEIAVTPAEFLRGETYKTAVRRNCWECPAEAEAVGQENVGAFGSEFLAVEILTEHDVADRGLNRWHNGVGGVPARTADMPAA